MGYTKMEVASNPALTVFMQEAGGPDPSIPEYLVVDTKEQELLDSMTDDERFQYLFGDWG